MNFLQLVFNNEEWGKDVTVGQGHLDFRSTCAISIQEFLHVIIKFELSLINISIQFELTTT